MGEGHGALEDMVKATGFWTGKKVFLTGHTGFKGGWLAMWLYRQGALVHGFSLEPPTATSLFGTAWVSKSLASDTRADLRDFPALSQALAKAAPDVILHLGAQALVRFSYREPLATLATNVLGTANLLEAARGVSGIKAIVSVTTDKCYDNKEWVFPYRENDSLGGHDTYAASKACAEIVTASYRASFFGDKHAPAIATARAGNVIGGGDWAEDRLVPDCVRAFIEGRSVELRYPDAVRPWQHVLEPLSGYLGLAEALCGPDSAQFREAWNFGPDASGDATVGEIARKVASAWGEGKVVTPPMEHRLHEAGLLRLDVTKARSRLHWSPQWTIGRALDETVAWYKAWHAGKDMHAFTMAQIDAFAGGV